MAKNNAIINLSDSRGPNPAYIDCNTVLKFSQISKKFTNSDHSDLCFFLSFFAFFLSSNIFVPIPLAPYGPKGFRRFLPLFFIFLRFFVPFCVPLTAPRVSSVFCPFFFIFLECFFLPFFSLSFFTFLLYQRFEDFY